MKVEVDTNLSLGTVERIFILAVLKDNDGNRTKTAESLGISIRCLRMKLNRYKDEGHFSDKADLIHTRTIDKPSAHC